MVGLSGIWIKYNIFSIASFSMFLVSRWAITAHHVCHGGYDKCDKYPYKRSTFGVGLRRFIDWFDWFDKLELYCSSVISILLTLESRIYLFLFIFGSRQNFRNRNEVERLICFFLCVVPNIVRLPNIHLHYYVYF